MPIYRTDPIFRICRIFRFSGLVGFPVIAVIVTIVTGNGAGDHGACGNHHVCAAEGVGIHGQFGEGNGEAVFRAAAKIAGSVGEHGNLGIAAAINREVADVVTDPGEYFVQCPAVNQQVVQEDVFGIRIHRDTDGAYFDAGVGVEHGAIGFRRAALRVGAAAGLSAESAWR